MRRFQWCVWMLLGCGQGRAGRGTCGRERSSLSHWYTWPPGQSVPSGDVQTAEKKKYGVSKYTTHFNTPKDQEAELFYEWHSVSMIPKMTLRFNCSLRFIEIKKSVILMLYYNEMMLIKISKRKRCMEQSPGETKHMLSSPSAVIRIALSNSWHINAYDIVPAREVHLSLGIWIFIGGRHGASTVANHNHSGFSLSRGRTDSLWPVVPTINHIVNTNHLMCPDAPGKQRYYYQGEYSKDLDIIFQKQIKR